MQHPTETEELLVADRLRLLKQKLGNLISWKNPQIVHTVGPYDPGVFDRFESRCRDAIAACKAKLRAFDDEDIIRILKGPVQGVPIAREWADFLSNEIYSLEKRVPEWHAGGFGHPDHVADFQYWAKMPMLNLGELTCLSVGINPSEFSTQHLSELSQTNARQKFSKTLEFLIQRFALLQRTFDPRRRDAGITPTSYLEWVERFEEDVHPGFLEPLRSFHLTKEASLEPSVAVRNDKRETDTMAQLFTAMAIDYLGYNPHKPRSPIPKEVSDLAASMGMTVSDETVRKYLRIGANFISKDWMPPKN